MLKKLKGIGLLLITNFLIMIMLGVVYVVLANFVLPAFGIHIRGSVDGPILLYAGVLGFAAVANHSYCSGYRFWETEGMRVSHYTLDLTLRLYTDPLLRQ